MDIVITEGARQLRQWMVERQLNIPKFCERYGFDRHQLQRLMKGTAKKVSVEMALDICRATDGAITIELWVPTRVPDSEAA